MPVSSGRVGPLDWAIVITFIVGSVSLALYFSRRSQKNTKEYFISGAGTPWWLLGTSMVATTFAADTPLAISGWVRTSGIAQNWFWWAQAMMVMAGVFFFARLWRRARLTTDMELVHLRYSGRPADILRAFKALYFALIFGSIVMGWVNKAMVKILETIFAGQVQQFAFRPVDQVLEKVILATKNSRGLADLLKSETFTAGLDSSQLASVNQALQNVGGLKEWYASNPDLATLALQYLVFDYKILFTLFIITVTYTALSGLWGVLVTDFVQFWMAMTGCIVLAVLAVMKFTPAGGGLEGIITQIQQLPDWGPEAVRHMLEIIPSPGSAGLTFTEFVVFVTIMWWTVGFTDGGSYLAQRMLAAKDERHAALGYLWYGIAHFCLRQWPWIVVGIVAIVAYPVLEDPEKGYILVMLDVLPAGLLGLMLAAFFAAYMSTVSSQVNVAASYILNDFYRPYIRPGQSDQHYVRVSIAATLFVALVGAVASLLIDQIGDAWFALAALNAGIGVVYILRWYWWRVSAWSEISCIISLVLIAYLNKYFPVLMNPLIWALKQIPELSSRLNYGESLSIPLYLLVSVPVSTLVWLAVTYLTPPTSDERLIKFYRRVRPGGPGWRRIAGLAGESDVPALFTWRNLMAYIASVVAIYSMLIGMGEFLFGNNLNGIICTVLTIGGFWIVWHNFSGKHWDSMQEEDQEESAAAGVT